MMDNPVQDRPVAGLVDPSCAETVEVLGPTVQFLTPVEADAAIGEDGPCVMRGTILPGVSVPLHSHRDPETFLMVAGEVEGIVESGGDFKSIAVQPGQVFHVPGGAKHAWRNHAATPAVMTIVSTNRMARFFSEVGSPVGLARPQDARQLPARIQHFMETADRYGYWNATPEENARLGISLPTSA
jgi:mannose-6-phosphate isomerase-like protein (cupin superfamily)